MLELREITKAYRTANLVQVALDRVSVAFRDNEFVAVLGQSGSGKTTLCNLMMRFWDVDSGSISVGGVDVRDQDPEDLLSLFAVVFQDVFLFSAIFLSNSLVISSDMTPPLQGYRGP